MKKSIVVHTGFWTYLLLFLVFLVFLSFVSPPLFRKILETLKEISETIGVAIGG